MMIDQNTLTKSNAFAPRESRVLYQSLSGKMKSQFNGPQSQLTNALNSLWSAFEHSYHVDLSNGLTLIDAVERELFELICPVNNLVECDKLPDILETFLDIDELIKTVAVKHSIETETLH